MPQSDNAAYAAAAAQVASEAINYASAAQANRKGREWAEKMYGVQRNDAIADWERNNEYNSPANQMKRFKDANLNPHLIYGQQTDSPAIRSSSVESWKPEAPKVNLSPSVNTLLSTYDLDLKQAQTDNLKATKDVLVQDALLRQAQTIQTIKSSDFTGVQTEQGKFNLKLAEQLETTTLEKSRQELQKLRVDTQFTLNADERATAQNAATLKQAAENILTSRLQRSKTQDEKTLIKAQIENLKKDGQLKQADINLKEKGIQPTDDTWIRVLAQYLSGQGVLNNIVPADDILKPLTAKPGAWHNKK